jgi:hypothetical protein
LRTSTVAIGALSTAEDRIDRNDRSHAKVVDAVAKTANAPHGLVTHHLSWLTAAVFTCVAMNVGAAYAGGNNFKQDLATSRSRIGTFAHCHTAEFLQHEDAHR